MKFKERLQAFTEAFMKKLKELLSAVVNLIGDVFVPIFSAISVIVEILPLPLKYKLLVKTIEEVLKDVGRTAEDIEVKIENLE